MHTYARIDNAVVAELLATPHDPRTLFHPALHWVAVTTPGVAVGWHLTASGFVPPPAAAPVPAVPSLSDLQAQVTALAAQVAALTAANAPAGH